MEKAKIIILEDDIDNLDLLCCELFDTYDLHPVSDEQFTLRDFERLRPDLIILDTEMQNVDIFSIYRQIKGNACLKKTPVLFATSASNTAHINALINLQIESYLQKPFHSLKLKTTIARLLP